MDFEKLFGLSMDEKKEILRDFIKNDSNYYKKLLLLMSMESEDTEFLDLIVDNKRAEIELANKKFKLGIEYNDSDKKRYISVMDKIINGSDDLNYIKACKEVLEILKFIPTKYYDMISDKFLNILKKGDNIDYKFVINSKAKFEDIVILNETRDILTLISNKFWNVDGRIINISDIFNK